MLPFVTFRIAKFPLLTCSKIDMALFIVPKAIFVPIRKRLRVKRKLVV